MKGTIFAGTMGWMNEARGSRGLVIAGAHGHEDLCSRRFLKLLADRAAEAGYPTLLFDYPGCGNAVGDHSAPGQVAAWTASIGAAIDHLKQESGVTDVVLAGFRLGALLAPFAAIGRDDVAGLMLLAPPASGKALVREIVAMSRMIDAPLASRAGKGDSFPEGREAAGFRLTHGTLADLAELDWRLAAADLPALPMLVLSNGRPVSLSEFQPGGNAEITMGEFDGYALLMCDPTANRIPDAVLDRCAEWLAVHAGKERTGQGARASSVPVLQGSNYTEEPVVITGGSAICGVLCRPAGLLASTEPVIFLNAGAVPHIGWARGTVEAARELAAKGMVSLRIDLPGLGVSGATDPGRLFLYDAETRNDVRRVIDWMEQAGFPALGLVGTCSGAFQAFHTARVDRRVRSLAMINPLCFAWNSSYALELAVWKTYEAAKAGSGSDGAAGAAGAAPASHSFVTALRSLAGRAGKRVVRRGLEAAKSFLTALHPAGLLGRRPVERWMRQLCSRGVRVLMVTSEGDLSLEEIARHFGPDGRRLDSIKGVTRLSLPNADHTLTPGHARRMVIDGLIQHAGIAREGSAPVKAIRAGAAPAVAS